MAAGRYRVICDSIVVREVDVTFELILRRGDRDVVLASHQHPFDPLPGNVYEAQPYEFDVIGSEIVFESGDQFVFRYTGRNASVQEAYFPNGDGPRLGGRFPTISFPE